MHAMLSTSILELEGILRPSLFNEGFLDISLRTPTDLCGKEMEYVLITIKEVAKEKNDNKYITYFLKTFLSTVLYEIKFLITSQASDPESL